MRRGQLKVLVINSYAGSITIAAAGMGLEIIGSYENKGYGQAIQRKNFPKLRYVERTVDWPRQNLRDVIVAAHPPCTPFCSQSAGQANKANRGPDAPAFRDTLAIMDYALGQHCAALAIESVTGACAGAREAHDHYAREHGYYLFRILQNSVTFGLAQFRPRFWAIFIRRDLADRLTVRHTPRFQTIADVMGAERDPGPPPFYAQQNFDSQLASARAYGLTARELRRALTSGRQFGALFKILACQLPGQVHNLSIIETARQVCGLRFFCGTINVLDPASVAGTLIANSTWYARGRLLAARECKAIMGFPRDYVFTDTYGKQIMTYLSRGVCPPVARWVFEVVIEAITGQRRLAEQPRELQPGETLDLRVKRATLAVALQQAELFGEEA